MNGKEDDTPREPVVYGYARVSSADQNEARQLIALRNAGIREGNIYIDHKSGKDFNRPAWRKLVRCIHPGDVLTVTSLDRFGRSYEDIIAEWRNIVKVKGVHMRVLDMPLLDTSAVHGLLAVFIADLVLQILSFVAQTEREQIRKRQAEGIAAAKRRGVKFGRPRIPLPVDFPQMAQAYEDGKCSLRMAAAGCGLSASTFRRHAAKGPSSANSAPDK